MPIAPEMIERMQLRHDPVVNVKGHGHMSKAAVDVGQQWKLDDSDVVGRKYHV